MEELKLTLVRKSIPVSLENAEGAVKRFTLREMSGAERDQYLTRTAERMAFDKNGLPTHIKNFDGLSASLLTLCLYNEEGNLVSRDEVQALPTTAQNAIFLAAQKLNGLEAPEKKKGAEDPNA